MNQLKFLKKVFNLHGKKVSWGIIETITDKNCQYHAGLIIKDSAVFLDVCERRFYSPVLLPEITRGIYSAQYIVDKNKVILTAFNEPEKCIILPKSFIKDIYGPAWYTPQLEQELLL